MPTTDKTTRTERLLALMKKGDDLSAAPGSAAATRRPTACYASTSPNEATSPFTPKPTSTASPPNSTIGLDKPSDRDHHHKYSTKRCNDHLRPQPFWRVSRADNGRDLERVLWARP
jgi:hypothetical protein